MAGPALTRSVLKSVARDPNKKDLYLTSDISGNMWVGLDKNPPESHWDVYAGPKKGLYYFVHAVGVHDGTLWALTYGDTTYKVSLSPFDPEAGPTPIQLWNVFGMGNPYLIYPMLRTDVLNPQGPYYRAGTGVIVWKWDHNPNSQWHIIPVA